MKKFRCILTKNGEVYTSEHLAHTSIAWQNHVKGKDSEDWVRVSIYKEGKEWKAKAKHIKFVELPEWLERQYGYYMKVVLDYFKKQNH